ncbi:MAG: T9SS C-terminal target domain-containing protein [Ignavibacteriae bacterium]|nr:MAG: T9SS C-terminal target domain-containing protein [Ignavibacteriota bacterium]
MWSLRSSYSTLAATLVLLIVQQYANAQIVVGSARHVSVLCSNGKVYSEGENRDGLLGDGTTIERQGFIQSSINGVRYLSSNYAGVVAVDLVGDVYYWGVVRLNIAGMPKWSTIEPTPKKIEYVSDVRKAVLSNGNVCYLLNSGRLLVSGANSQGQHGNGTTTELDSGGTYASLDSIIDVFCAVETIYAVRSDGSIWAWGSNYKNFIDTTSAANYPLPVRILQTSGVRATSGTFGFSNALGSMRIVDSNGDVYVWGQNDKNQLGVEGVKWLTKPYKLTLPCKALSVSGGVDHTIVLCEDGTVWSFGDNSYGQLGYPYKQNAVEPVSVIGLSNVVAIGSGLYSSYAISRDGSLYGWGDNTYHQLDPGDIPRQYTAIPLGAPCSLVSGMIDGDMTQSLLSIPNPISDIVSVPINEETTRVDVYSIEGRCVYGVALSIIADHVTIDMTSESPGVYMIVRTMKDRVAVESVIKH